MTHTSPNKSLTISGPGRKDRAVTVRLYGPDRFQAKQAAAAIRQYAADLGIAPLAVDYEVTP